MKKWHIILLSVFFSIVKAACVFSEGIKLPDEIILGETLRVEKTAIFISPVPVFNVIFPKLTAPPPATAMIEEEIIPQEVEEYKETTSHKNYLSLAGGTDELIHTTFFYKNKNDVGTEHSVFLDNYFTSGYRENAEEQKNSFVFNWSKPHSGRFSFEFDKNYIGLPGKESNPMDADRDSLSFRTNYQYLGKQGFRPSIKQSFYSMDGVEVNFLSLDLQFITSLLTLETILERQDVFNDFSTMSLYQGLFIEKGQVTAGAGVKLIESYGVRFLPVIRYSINENFNIGLEGLYYVPDLYPEVMSTNYKELTDYDLTPEEQYRVSAVFSKTTENTAFRIELSQTWKENFYTWVDADVNDLLEPYPEQCWQTAVSINFNQSLSHYVSFFLTGEKDFLSKSIDFYPEERVDAGIILSSSSLMGKLYLSYIGERTFPDVEIGSDTTLNAEFKMLLGGRTEWGVGLYNIWDRQYFTVPGYPAEGRRFVTYVKWFF